MTFTSGGTESNNLAVLGMAEGARSRDRRRTCVVLSAIEHDSIPVSYTHLDVYKRQVMNIVVAACWAFTKLVWPWKIEEAELLTKDARGRVIIQNHESMVEPVIMVVTLWRAGIHTRIVYKSEFDKISIATWLFSRVGGFPVSRGTADMKLIRRARAMLQRGECVLIYPEGTRVKDDADAEVHGGYALMALSLIHILAVDVHARIELAAHLRVDVAVGEVLVELRDRSRGNGVADEDDALSLIHILAGREKPRCGRGQA